VAGHIRQVPTPPASALGRRLWTRLVRVPDWKVHTKLGAVLTVPAVAFVSVAGLQTNASVREGEALQGFTRQVNLSRQLATLIHELQRERTGGMLTPALRAELQQTLPRP
jgi:hypothetical protein